MPLRLGSKTYAICKLISRIHASKIVISVALACVAPQLKIIAGGCFVRTDSGWSELTVVHLHVLTLPLK
ncbi:hypothetical protein, partial [Pseudomonas syringae group genomosp. 3]|uniref:hypothetical protein n=1 Tax=Pseudomonas syringae group genomosp. 3 TaxID=251701 RepID=UPI001C8261F9